jgi:release factor glutamine methyltransferase
MFPSDQVWTVSKAFTIAKDWLNGNGIEDSEDSARHLLCHAASLGTKYTDFTNNLQKQILPEQLKSFSKYCTERSKRMPVQYIVGNWDFYGHTYQCKPPVLIPRPETEELIEKIVESKIISSLTSPRILDVGAGSGVIGITLSTLFPLAQITAIDINPIAVDLANSNAAQILGKQNHPSRYQCLHTSFQDFATMSSSSHAFDLIVSNPPYIPSADMSTLQPEVQHYEDHMALDGGIDGLDMIQVLLHQGGQLLNPAGTREIWMEVSHTHPSALSSLEQHNPHNPYQLIQSYQDLSGFPRFVRYRYHR